MDDQALGEVLRDAVHRQFWIVLWGIPENSPDQDEQIFDQPFYDHGFPFNPSAMKIDDILFIHRIHISKIIYVGEIADLPRKSSVEEISKEPWRKRWTRSARLKNLVPTYGSQWGDLAEKTFTLKDQYNRLNSSEQVNLGRLNFGAPVRISEGFAKFLIKEITSLR